MAVELCSDTSSSMGISPRISFSHDFTTHSGDGGVAIEQYIRSTSPSSSIDFDFCVFRESFTESSPADELFSEGKILPIEIKRQLGSNSNSSSVSSSHSTSTKMKHPESSSSSSSSSVETIKNAKNESVEKTGESDEKGSKDKDRSFWKFKRSYSLNCGSGYGSSLNLCPLPLMSRSNSTGSRSSSGKETGFSHSKQQSSSKSPLIASSSSSIKQSHLKPPLKKSYGAYSNGVKVTPLINVPSASMFGLGSIFSPSKDKSKRKQ